MNKFLNMFIFMSFFSLVCATESPKTCPSVPTNKMDITSSIQDRKVKRYPNLEEYSPAFLNQENLQFTPKKGLSPRRTPTGSPSVSPQISTANLTPDKK